MTDMPELPKIESSPSVGQIELEKKPMSKEEASKMLHVVATVPIKEEKTEDQIEKEKYEDRKKTSDELSEQAIELESMDFNAKDLNNFTALG